VQLQLEHAPPAGSSFTSSVSLPGTVDPSVFRGKAPHGRVPQTQFDEKRPAIPRRGPMRLAAFPGASECSAVPRLFGRPIAY